MPIVALSLLKRFWWAIPVALLFAALMVTRHTLASRTDALEREKAASVLFAARVEAKSNEIIARAQANARRVETAQTQIQQEKDHAIRASGDANARAARLWAETHRADSRSCGNTMPGPPGPASNPDGAGQEAVVPAHDLELCAIAVTKAEGWSAWYKSISAIPR